MCVLRPNASLSLDFALFSPSLLWRTIANNPQTLRDRLGYKHHHGNHGLIPPNQHVGTGNFFITQSMA